MIAEHPTRLFQARSIITLAGPPVEAIVTVGEQIVAAGTRERVHERFPDVDRVDLGDGIVVPGFNDAHMHPSQAAEDLLHVDVSADAVQSNAAILATLRNAAVALEPGAWVRASRHDDGKMAEHQLLTRWDLDESVPDDRAIALLLEQFEAVAAEHPWPDAHHRIEHCSVVTEDILRRMRALGAIAVPFGSYVHYHGGNLLKWYGVERAERMFAHRAFIDAGVAVAGSSDFPCGPFEPLLAMQSCVTRTGWDGASIGTSQRISPLEALELYTTRAAYATGEDAIKGRLAPGYLADFVVLDANPLEADPARLSQIGVRATYVGGERVWPVPSRA